MGCQFTVSQEKMLQAGPPEQPFRGWRMNPRLGEWHSRAWSCLVRSSLQRGHTQRIGDFLSKCSLNPQIQTLRRNEHRLSQDTKVPQLSHLYSRAPHFLLLGLWPVLLDSVVGQDDLVTSWAETKNNRRSWKTKGWSNPGHSLRGYPLVRGWLHSKASKAEIPCLSQKTRESHQNW